MNPHIVVVGSLNADFVLRLEHFPVPGETVVGRDFNLFPGGKGANQAFGAARLGARVTLLGQVGNDAHGEWLLHHLADGRVDVSHVGRDPLVSSGVATITINGEGQNQIVVIPGANGTFHPAQLALSQGVIAQAGIILLQLEIPLSTVQAAARAAREAGALVILDPAPAQALGEPLLGLVDYLTPNETELAILTQTSPRALDRSQAGQMARRLLAQGARRIIVKMGAQGALLVTAQGEHFWPAIPVKALDTTAAGDAFNAAFAVALVQGRSELEAGQYASAAAACSVTRQGAQPSMPTQAEVEALRSPSNLPGQV